MTVSLDDRLAALPEHRRAAVETRTLQLIAEERVRQMSDAGGGSDAIGRPDAWEPRVADVRYDRVRSVVVVDLTNGCTFVFPPRSLQGLEAASDDEIAAVQILDRGAGLHWEVGGADYTIAGLLAGRFGSRSFMETRFRADSDRNSAGPVTA